MNSTSTNERPRRRLLVSDLHGELELLEDSLRHIGFDPAYDVLWSLGNMIDYGPKSLETLLAFVGPARRRGFHSLMGNHEAMLLANLYQKELQRPDYLNVPPDIGGVHRLNGGAWADRWHDLLMMLRSELLALPLCKMLSLSDGRRVGLVHAEVHSAHTWQDLEQWTLSLHELLDTYTRNPGPTALWGGSRYRWAMRELFPDPENPASTAELDLNRRTQGIDLVVAGHTLTRKGIPMRWGNHLWIHTGAKLFELGGEMEVLNVGWLTIVDIDTNAYWRSTHADSTQPGSLLVEGPTAL